MMNFHNKPNIFVNELVLKVTDIDRSIKFYTKMMGFSILKKNGKEASLTADGFQPIITLIEPEDIVPKIPKRTGLYHIAILLPSRYHLGLFLKNIRDEWYPIIGGSNHGVSEAIYLEDTDGNGIEVYRDVATTQWSRSGDRINMISEPLDYDQLIAEAGEDKWGNTPLDTIIGHIHLHVGDLDKAKKFYCDGLGFDLTMEAGSSALFLSSGGYHHHIGLNVWNGRNADPPPDNSAGMKYYSMVYPDKDTLDRTLDNLVNLGYDVNKEGKEIFTKDPSSNLIKLTV